MRRVLLALLALAAGGCSDGSVSVDHLAVIHVGPSPGASGIGVDADVRVTFSKVLRAESVNQGSICVRPSSSGDETACAGDAVPALVSYDPLDLAITVSPLLLLTTGTEYAVVVTSEIRGESGSLPAPIRTLFTTETP